MNTSVGKPWRQVKVEPADRAGLLVRRPDVGPYRATDLRHEGPVDEHVGCRRFVSCAHPAGKADAAEPAQRARTVRISRLVGNPIERNRRPHPRSQIRDPRLDDRALPRDGVMKGNGKAVAAIADLLSGELIYIGIGAKHLDRVAVDHDFDSELFAKTGGIEDESEKPAFAG